MLPGRQLHIFQSGKEISSLCSEQESEMNSCVAGGRRKLPRRSTLFRP